MSQQLAFDIVKTVVTARDEARALPAPLAAAWGMLREELGVQARAAVEEVTWGPEHRDALRQVIDGVRDCFVNDVGLEAEFATLLAESTELAALPTAPAADRSPAADLPPAAADLTQATAVPSSAASDGAIPMIELSDDLLGEAPPAEEEERDAGAAPEASPVAPAVTAPAVTAPALERVAAPTTEAPNHRSPRLIAVGIVVGLLLVLGLTLLFVGGDAPEDEPPPPTAEASPTPPELDGLLQGRNFAGAEAAQRAHVSALVAGGAPLELAAAATAQLAEVASRGDRPDTAVAVQRRALALARAAFGDEAPAVAEAHLDIASYYVTAGESHMAEAHYRQARKLLRGAPAALTEERASRLQQLGDRLGVSE